MMHLSSLWSGGSTLFTWKPARLCRLEDWHERERERKGNRERTRETECRGRGRWRVRGRDWVKKVKEEERMNKIWKTGDAVTETGAECEGEKEKRAGDLAARAEKSVQKRMERKEEGGAGNG